jgi:hypothetical protein
LFAWRGRPMQQFSQCVGTHADTSSNCPRFTEVTCYTSLPFCFIKYSFLGFVSSCFRHRYWDWTFANQPSPNHIRRAIFSFLIIHE